MTIKFRGFFALFFFFWEGRGEWRGSINLNSKKLLHLEAAWNLFEYLFDSGFQVGNVVYHSFNCKLIHDTDFRAFLWTLMDLESRDKAEDIPK